MFPFKLKKKIKKWGVPAFEESDLVGQINSWFLLLPRTGYRVRESSHGF